MSPRPDAAHTWVLVCCHCHRVHDEVSGWVEPYDPGPPDGPVSHGYCPKCVSRLYPELRLIEPVPVPV
jgi:hypothetical protein